ncbi:MAG: thioredoxin [Lachnospiraceae bacterium]|nr:thioredoxin [Lachnospiraceae bacterium]
METNLTLENFESEAVKSELPVLIDFWAPWCGPCRMLGPVVEKIANDLAGKVKVCKINVDEEGELAKQFKIMSIPTLVVMKNGEVTKKSIGYISEEEILELLA